MRLSHSFGAGILLLGLLLIPLWSFAQERGPLLTLDVVSPLGGESIDSVVVLQAIPSVSDNRVVVSARVEYGGRSETISLSSSSSWMGSWPLPADYAGDVSISFEACILSSCVVEQRSIQIVRSSFDSVSVREESSSRHRSREERGDSSSLPSEVSSFSVLPSTVFSLTEVLVDGVRVVSSGDSFLLPSDTYSFHQSFPGFSLFDSLFLDGVVVSSSGTLTGVFSPLSLEWWEYRGDFFSVDRSWVLDVGFDFDSGNLSVPLVKGSVLFVCTNYSFDSDSCRVTWSPVSLDGDHWVSSFNSRRTVWVVGHRMSSPPVPVPIHDVVLSNVPGDYYASSPRQGVLGPFGSDSVSLVQGRYSISLHPYDSPLLSVRAEDVNVDHAGTFLAMGGWSSSSLESGFEQWVFSLNYVEEAVPVLLARDVDSSSVRYCSSWSSETEECLSRWAAGRFSFLEPGTSSLIFSRRVAPPDGVVPDVNVGAVDPLLVQAIVDLKAVHTNKRFFSAGHSRDAFEALSTLFSSVEVNLECGSSGDVVAPFSSAESIRDSVSRLGSVLSSGSSPAEGVPLSYWDAGSTFFYTNEWESFLPRQSDWRQREGVLECDGVRLDHAFTFSGSPPDTKIVHLGGSPYRVKETLSLSNDTDVEQFRRVAIRLESPFSSLTMESGALSPSPIYVRVPSRKEVTEIVDSSTEEFGSYSYTTIRDSFVQFHDSSGFRGSYDFSDFLASGFDPLTVVHARDGSSIVETVLSVRIPPRSQVLLDPVYDLNSAVNYSVRFAGGIATDYLGATNTSFGALTDNPQGAGIRWVNVDNNSYVNDLLINTVYADVNGKADVGAVYLIKDVDFRSGSFDMNSMSNYDVRWNGGLATDRIGYSFTVGDGMLLVDLDGNGYTNDLILTATLKDYVAADVGAVILIKDIDKKPRQNITDLNHAANYDAMWVGRTASDDLGYTNQSGQGVQIHNLDNGPVANDLIILGGIYDAARRKLNSGAIFVVLDANGYKGIFDTNVLSSFTSAIWGARYGDSVGGSFQSQESLLVRDIDGNGWANDLIISCAGCDVNDQNGHGIIYGIKDIHTKSAVLDLNVSTSYAFRVHGRGINDAISGTAQNGQGIFVEDTDANGYRNDLIVVAPASNQAGTTRGAVYYLRDINTLTGDHNVATSTRVNLTIVGASNADQIGRTFASGNGVQLVNVDGNVVANDLIITSYLHNSGLTDNGAVFYINDINRRSGTLTLNTTTTNFTALFEGPRASDLLGDINFTGQGVQLVNVDGNAWANDLLIGASMGDTGKINTGSIFLVKDINAKTGIFDFNTTSNYAVRFARETDIQHYLGMTRGNGGQMRLYDVDGNGYTNDLIVAAPLADVNNKVDAGVVYLLKDIDKKIGNVDINTAATDPTAIAWTGHAANAWLGHNAGSGPPFRVVNFDNNAIANDLIIHDSNADTRTTNVGVVYLIQDIGSIDPGFYDLNNENFFTKAWAGSTAADMVGNTIGSLDGDFNVNIDNNAYTNDLIISAPQVDTNSKANSGAVYLLRDVLVSSSVVLDYSFVLNLPSSGCTVGKGNSTGGTSCQKGYIETTDTNAGADENKVNPEGQSTTVPFLVYDNQSSSSSDLNIFLDVNAALPGSLKLKVSTIYDGWAFTCAGNTDTNCVELSASQQSVGKATYSAGAQDLNLFIWGDFVAAAVGDVDRNVDSNAGSST